MLKFFVNDQDATTGSIPVSWCIDDDTFLYLKEEKSKNPQIIIYITPESNYDLTYIIQVPFKNMMTYIPLRFKGKNRIFVRILLDDQSYYFSNEIRYTDLEPLGIEDSVTQKIMINGYEIGKAFDDYHSELLMKTYLTIDVPEECFAKEPFEWEKAWVNAMIKGRAFDQCEFRRRRLWAYSIQPLIALFLIILRILPTLVAFIIAAKGISLKYIFHPFAINLLDTGDMFTNGYLFVRSNQPTWFKKYCLFPLTPIISFPIIAVIILCLIGKLAIINVINILLVVLAVSVGIVLFSILIITIINFIIKYQENFNWYDDQSEIEAIVCDGSVVPTEISKLPQKKRTIHLRYQAIKNKVCKPFAG